MSLCGGLHPCILEVARIRLGIFDFRYVFHGSGFELAFGVTELLSDFCFTLVNQLLVWVSVCAQPG